jgi:hypothetical protein
MLPRIVPARPEARMRQHGRRRARQQPHIQGDEMCAPGLRVTRLVGDELCGDRAQHCLQTTCAHQF